MAKKKIDPKAKPKHKPVRQTKFPNMTDKREAKLEKLGLLYLQAKAERKAADDAVKNAEFACLAEMKRIKRQTYTVGDTTLNVKNKESISVSTGKRDSDDDDHPTKRAVDKERAAAAEKTKYGGEEEKPAPKEEPKDEDQEQKVVAPAAG